ncbi:MAG: hypothetical protein JW384_01938 [Nitrosomonadaceae bacterium]|nr:hypothetical protein [Nitrosomonadaceae bacterium]
MTSPFSLLSIQQHSVPSRVRSRCASRIFSSERFDDRVITRIRVEVGTEHVFCYQSMTHSTKLALIPLNLTELGGSCGDFRASEEHRVMFG